MQRKAKRNNIALKEYEIHDKPHLYKQVYNSILMRKVEIAEKERRKILDKFMKFCSVQKFIVEIKGIYFSS